MLTQDQSDFLDKLIPWSWDVENQTQAKAREYRGIKNAKGLSSIVFTLEVLTASDWGNHPLSQETFKNKPCNNLTLIDADSFYEGRRARFEDKDYRAFDNWDDFCIQYSDWIVFSGEYDKLLIEQDYKKQLELFALIKDDKECYHKMIRILSLLGIKHE